MMTTQGKESSMNDDAGRAAASSARQLETRNARFDKDRIARKRNREKQKRDDISDGLEQLIELLFRIDPRLKSEAEKRQENSPHGGRVARGALLTRVELVNCAVATLDRLHQEYEEGGTMIARLSKRHLAEANGSSPPPPPPPPSTDALSFPNPRNVQLNGMDLLAAGASIALSGMNLLPLCNKVLAPELTRDGFEGACNIRGESAFMRIPMDRNLLDTRGHSSLGTNHDFFGAENAARYQAIWNENVPKESDIARVAARLDSAAADFFGDSRLSTISPPTLVGSSGVLADSLRQRMIREQMIAQFAATQGKETGGFEDISPAAKKLKPS